MKPKIQNKIESFIKILKKYYLKKLVSVAPSGRTRRVDPDPHPIGSESKIFDLSGPGLKIFISPGPGP
jgi:hypothetical protein